MKIAYYEESGKMSVVDLDKPKIQKADDAITVSYTHLRAHET